MLKLTSVSFTFCFLTFSRNKWVQQHRLALFTLGFKMRLGRSDHKQTAEAHRQPHLCIMHLQGVQLTTYVQISLLPHAELLQCPCRGRIQDTLPFTLQKTCGQMHPRPPQQVVWVIVSQWVIVVAYTYIYRCRLAIRWPKMNFKAKCKQGR